jgi:hypothetical protein
VFSVGLLGSLVLLGVFPAGGQGGGGSLQARKRYA